MGGRRGLAGNEVGAGFSFRWIVKLWVVTHLVDCESIY